MGLFVEPSTVTGRAYVLAPTSRLGEADTGLGGDQNGIYLPTNLPVYYNPHVQHAHCCLRNQEFNS
jgi:hypothetical protein